MSVSSQKENRRWEKKKRTGSVLRAVSPLPSDLTSAADRTACLESPARYNSPSGSLARQCPRLTRTRAHESHTGINSFRFVRLVDNKEPDDKTSTPIHRI